MIRGNYSLAKDVRKNEQKSKQKIQARQKHQSKLEQLSSVDPIRVFLQLERLEKVESPDQFQQKKISRLRQDWAFIRKNKLHETKVTSFLENRQKANEARDKEQRKLRGKDSIYFNPELNPLGKVPNIENLTSKCGPLPNLTKPMKPGQAYEQDPLIQEFNIKPPQSPPPRFYKKVQNTHRSNNHPNTKSQDMCAEEKSDRAADLNSDSYNETDSDD